MIFFPIQIILSLAGTLVSQVNSRVLYSSSILKEIRPEYSLEGLILKLKLQYFSHLMWRTDSLEKNLMLGMIEGRKGRGWQRMRWLDGVTNSMDMSLHGVSVLQSMGSQRVRHNWVSDLTDLNCVSVCVCVHAQSPQSYLSFCDPEDCIPPGSPVHGESPDKTTGVGFHALLQGIFPNQGSNPSLLHCRWIIYHWATGEAHLCILLQFKQKTPGWPGL